MSRNRMQTAYRKDVSTLFDVFCEVGATIDDGTSIILQKYPEDFSDCQTLKSIGQFCFPCGPHYDNWEAVQMFTFVLTDEKSEYTYAFCRLTPHNNTCLCILSGLQWPNVFYKILNHLSEIMNNRPVDELELFLNCAYKSCIPSPCKAVALQSSPNVNVLITAPDLTKLPSLREDKFMFEFFNGITEKQLITIYAGLLKERRILFTSQKLSQLSSCVFGAAALLRPMHWQSLFIPVLPFHLIDMLMAPMPYLIGVPKKILESVKSIDLGDVMVIDLDLRTVHCIFNDVVDLPSEALSILRQHLRSASNIFLSDGLARAFLRTNVFLFGGYQKGLSCSAVTFSWDCKKFIHNQKPSLQSYLRSLIEEDGVQYLERFIDERIAALNAGEPIDDEFEKEIRAMEMQSKSSHQNHPEMLHNAVTSVRENASDVIGLLKDKVHSMSLKDRFGRLTPKEMRSPSQRQSHLPNNEALSFDTQEWKVEKEVEIDSQVVDSSDDEMPDLIDFGDDSFVVVHDDVTSSPSSSQNLRENATTRDKKNPTVNVTHQYPSDLAHFDPLATSNCELEEQKSSSAPKNGWQRFD